MARKRGDQTFAGMILDEERNNGRDDTLVADEADKVLIGLPLDALSKRYVFMNDCLILGRVIQIEGWQQQRKSTLLFELFRWHARQPFQGGGEYLLTEPRDQPDLRRAILGPELYGSVRLHQCRTTEAWQTCGVQFIKRLAKRYGDAAACPFPVMLGLDSMAGVTHEAAYKKVWKDGHASVGFGIDANLNNTYFKAVFYDAADWPLTWVFTNHLRAGQDAMGNYVERTPGGVTIHFAVTWELKLRVIYDYNYASKVGKRVVIEVVKNSSGPRSGHRLEVDVLHGFDDNGEQWMDWDWHGATTTLLLGYGQSKNPAWPSLKRQIDEIVCLEDHGGRGNHDDEHAGDRRVSCPALGLTKVHYDEAGRAIEENAPIREALDMLFGIRKRIPFRPGVPYNKQLQDARRAARPAYAAAQADPAAAPAEAGAPAAEAPAAPPPSQEEATQAVARERGRRRRHRQEEADRSA